ncbi:aromatic motif membrane protein [Mycoplasma sp. E35C]|uniref:aromatic motif membrane protein n=1 Tax=Mycoplasma sp. E35C TaxID=2801918 RepID=UPI001CA3F8E6|nr:aromatic motif membrane protein [Mycoplasma sp. E35C]QZX48975.1 hypothetical protein JJE79_02875 [Mycoplasma sp. E35C]
MRLGRLIKLFSSFAFVGLISSSCVHLNKEDYAEIKKQNLEKEQKVVILNKDEFLKQKAIQSLLEEAFNKNKTLIDNYVKEQLVDKHDQIYNDFKETLSYYTISISENWPGYFTKKPAELTANRTKFNSLLSDNWLFFLYNYQKFSFLGTSSTSGINNGASQFQLRHSANLSWTLQAETNKIKDFALSILPSYKSEDRGELSKLPKATKDENGVYRYENYPYYKSIFYLKMDNDTVVEISVTHSDETTVELNNRIFSLEKIQTKKIADFNIDEYAKSVYKPDFDTEAITNKYLNKTSYYEAEYGNAVPYLINYIN